jgi:signal transduction histidine kinase
LPLDPAAEEHLYRAALEAVTNAVKHASAGSICVRVRGLGECVEVCVTDDGRGFEPASAGSVGMGMGMGTMRARLGSLGGSVDVRSRPGAGTTVRLVVPL